MSKFAIVKQAPAELDKDCIVIPAPNFIEEVAMSDRKRPANRTMTPNYLREIIARIGDRYAEEDFNTLTSVNVSPYKGVPCETTEQVHDVVLKVLQTSYPKMFDLFVEYHIKSRPFGTRLIYFTGNLAQASKFYEHGIEEVKEKEIATYLGKKAKKIVGKPAVTNDEVGDENVV